MSRRFQGKVAIVTGGTTGIGRAVAIAFSREGARVVIAARRPELGKKLVTEIESSGGTANFISADVSRADQVRSLIQETIKQYGRLDCAVNNAAVLGPSRRTAEYTEEEFDQEIDLNLKSVWLCMRSEIEQMLAQEPRGGAIVNVSSVNGLGGVRGAALYAMAKAGVIALSKSAAQEYASEGIRVNVLVPGGFDTPMLDAVMERAGGGYAETRKKIEQQFASMVPLQRIGRPEEAAEAVLWLCSDAASYLTGHSLIVDGGLTCWAR